MGVCTSDPLTYLIKEYGADVCKYIVSTKAEEYVDKTVPTITSKVQEEFKKTAGSLDKEFDSKENAIKANFDSTIASVKQNNPTALENAKQSQNKTEEQLLGFDSIQQQFNKLKSTKDSKLKDQQNSIVKMLQQKKQEIKSTIKNSRPSLPLLDSMPVCLKLRALSEAEDKYAPEIKQKQTQISGLFDKITNLGDLQGTIKRAVGLNEADQLVKTSSSTFEKGQKLLTLVNNPAAGMKACC